MRNVDSLEKTLMLGGLGWRGEGEDRGWDGWMASPNWWTWVWVNSRSWSWTGRLGVLQFMGSQRVGHDWATELHWVESVLGPFQVALVVKKQKQKQKNLPANAGDVGLTLGSKNPLEEGMATHSSILACRIPWTGEPGGLQPVGLQRVGHNWNDLAPTHNSLLKGRLTCVLIQRGLLENQDWLFRINFFLN